MGHEGDGVFGALETVLNGLERRLEELKIRGKIVTIQNC